MFNAIYRNASSAEAIKFNHRANKDKISHANGLKVPLDDVRARGEHSTIPKSTISDKIEGALQLIRSLTDISLKINHYYGRQVLFTLSSAFICVTVQLYYLIIHMWFSFTGIDQLYALCSCILIAMHLVEFGAILMVGDKVKKEVRCLEILLL